MLLNIFDVSVVARLLFFIIGSLLLPVGLGIVARKRGLSTVTHTLSIMIGVLFGPGILALIALVNLPNSTWIILGIGSGALGYLSMIVGIFLPKRITVENAGVTLPIPLPPGTRD